MLALAEAGGAHGLWLRAEAQSGGKGRQGRSWISGSGNLHASTLVRLIPGDPPAPTLALLAAVALQEVAAAYLGPDRARIKWPNDLMLLIPGPGVAGRQEFAKFAGILLERAGDAVVIGFGVNLARHPEPEDVDRPVANLAAAGIDPPAPDGFLMELAESFARWFGRWRSEALRPVRDRWLEQAHPIGTALAVRAADGASVEGLFDGLDEGGALRLRLADGSLHVMHAGDVFLI